MTISKQKFSTLKQLAEAVVAMFGRNCEVAVHDVSNLDSSLIYLAGDVTGRRIGAPATDLLIKTLREHPDNIDDLLNYKTTTRDGRTIKSTTTFLRDGDGKIFAAFCINVDTTNFFHAAQALAPFIDSHTDQQIPVRETFATSAAETVEALFQQCVVEQGKQPATMLTQEKIQLVAQLEAQGVFQMKGAVKRVAELAGVSKHTIYNYLRIIRQPQERIYEGKNDEKSYPN